MPADGDASPTDGETRDLIGTLKSNGRLLMFAGLAFMGLAFVLSWWSLTKYRVSQERGVNLAIPADKQVMLDKIGDELADYQTEVARYNSEWEVNFRQYNDFYSGYVGKGYMSDMNTQIERSLRQGTVYFRGWSTWTGWFGFLTILAVIGLYVAPKFVPDEMEPWAWTAPWVGAAMGGLYLLLALSFYFNVPDENGAGYSQGVALGGYVAILAGLATAVGGLFEGLNTVQHRLQAIESEPEVEEEEQEEITSPQPAKRPVAPPSSPPQAPPKSRLTDW